MSFDSFYASQDWYYTQRPSEELEEFLKGVPVSGCALDLGCGEGRDSILLAKSGYTVTSVDRSKAGIDKLAFAARAMKLPITAITSDVETFDLGQEQFDLVCAVTILDHLDRAVARRVAARIMNALRPGGVLFAEVFTVEDPGFTGQGDASETADFVRHYFSHGELRELFAGLEVIAYEEKLERDETHGLPHTHGIAVLLARKHA